MKSTKLTKEELLILSDTVLYQMSQLGNVNEFAISSDTKNAIDNELKRLKELNSKLCRMFDEIA